MPLYDYHCTACGNEFTERRCIAERDAATRCPQCSAPEVERLMQVPMAFSHGSMGEAPRSVGLSGCGSCGGGSCSTCGKN